MTFFTFTFAFACLATFACGLRPQWKDARMISAIVAILSFALALASASVPGK